MIRIAIGYDPSETVAFHVLAQSILEQCTQPVQIIPIANTLIRDYMWRERDPKQSNDFSFSRFLAPHFVGYQGWVLFMDCDMMFRADPAELWELRDDKYAVMVCKHDYTPKTQRKFLGNTQTVYPRKNWSSVMLMNCSHPSTKRLTPGVVNRAPGLWLHRFEWCQPDEIGSLPLVWNWLEFEYEKNPDAKNVHWTVAGPWHLVRENGETRIPDYMGEWEIMLERANYSDKTLIDLET